MRRKFLHLIIILLTCLVASAALTIMMLFLFSFCAFYLLISVSPIFFIFIVPPIILELL